MKYNPEEHNLERLLRTRNECDKDGNLLSSKTAKKPVKKAAKKTKK